MTSYYSFKSSTFVLFLWNLIVVQGQGNDCECLEYWDCIGQGGVPFAYCDYSDKVLCCFSGSAKSGATVGILPKKGKVASCGRKGADSGKEGISEQGEWPWHVAILEKPLELYVCGGSLVDEYWVLTAAHCVDDYSSGRALKVRLGEHDVSSSVERHPHEEYDCSRVLLHPRFDNETLENDVALLRLAAPARHRPHIDVVCLPQTETEEREMTSSPTNCYITGWGRRTEASNHSFVLKEVKVPIWDQERCESALQLQFGTEFALPRTSLCAGAEGRDACDGDGGGPLVCRKKSRWYQLGIVSFGIGCGRRNTPGVYTRVQAYSAWIHDTVARYANDT